MKNASGLIAVLGSAAAMRLFHLHAISSSPFFDHPVLDGAFSDQWALTILSGSAPAAPFYQDPLYPYLLALLYRLFGYSHLAVYLFQALLGVATAGLIFDITRRVFDHRSAVVAGLIAAFYRPFIFYDVQLEKTSVTVALVAIWLWLSVLAIERDGRFRTFVAGAALGAACLTRGNLLAFVLLFPVIFLIPRAPGRQSAGPATGRPDISRRWFAASAIAGSLIVLAPVSARNSLLGREFLLTTTMLGQNFYAGNNSGNPYGQNGTPPWVRTSPEFEEADFAAHAELESGRQLTRGEVSSYYVRSALRWALAEPRDFLVLFLRKIALFLSRVEVPDNQDIGFFERYSPILRLPLPGFGFVFALGCPGMVLLGRGAVVRRWLSLFFLVYALSTVLFFVLSRYRVVAVPAMIPFAGASACRLAEALMEAIRGAPLRRFLSALAAVLLALALTHLPVHGVPPTTVGAQTLANLGAVLYHEGDSPAAEKAFTEALALDSNLVGAWRSLGVLRYSSGDLPGAYPALLRASHLNPDDAVSRYYLGLILETHGDLEAAEGEFRVAARMLPGRADFKQAHDRVMSRLAKSRK